MKLFTILTNGGVTITDGKSTPVQVNEDHPKFKSILSMLEKDGTTIKDVLAAIDLKSQLFYKDDNIEVSFSKSKSDEQEDISDNDDETLVVRIAGRVIDEVPEAIKKRILDMIKDIENASTKFNFSIFGKFLSRLYQNPSFKVVEQLYRFMEHNKLPITQDGTFLAYKKVDFDYKDLYSHTIDNSIGQTPTLTRNMVEDDPNKTCSHGLHVCSKDYLPEYGSNISTINRVIIVEVDPIDVVSVPLDYNNAKMRVCKYTVIDEITDFNAELARYCCGKHPKGWINETLTKLKEFYIRFWSLNSLKTFDWNYIQNRDRFWNYAIRDKFIAAVLDEFSYDITKCYSYEENTIEMVAYHPLHLFNYLSRCDSNSLTSPDDKENS
jgi:hypothetical protein